MYQVLTNRCKLYLDEAVCKIMEAYSQERDTETATERYRERNRKRAREEASAGAVP